MLVTGGGGFIGSHLTERLTRDGHGVRVLDNFATGRRENLLGLADDIELIEGDLQSYERVHNAVRGCEVVFHQGALPSVPRSVQDPLTSNATIRRGDAQRPARRARRRGATRRIRLVLVRLREEPHAAEARGSDPAPILTLRRREARLRGLLPQLLRGLRARDREPALFNVFGPRQDPWSQYAAVIPLFMGPGGCSRAWRRSQATPRFFRIPS
jgi:UDP-glucose 4-epimerase